MIYLDYAANYPTKKIVLDYLSEVELKYYANLNSSHKFGKRCLDFVKNENNLILQLLGLNDDYEIVHTSSATEANNLAIKGIVKAYSGFGNKVLVSELEHNSINGCLGFLKENGLVVDFIKTSNGHIDPIDLKNKMSNNVILVIATMLDSEVGTVEPIDEILEAIKNFPNAHFLCDVTQSISKYQFDYNKLELFSFTPHKFGGLVGTGLLVKRKSTILTPIIHGGESLSIYRSGSIPIGLISSSYMAIKLMVDDFENRIGYIKQLSSCFINEVKKINNIKINSVENLFIINLSIDGYKGYEIVDIFSDNDIYISQKSACSIKHTPSKIVLSMYKDKKRALSSFRISLSEYNNKIELDQVLELLRRLACGTYKRN